MSFSKRLKKAAGLSVGGMAFAGATTLSALAGEITYGDVDLAPGNIAIGDNGFGALVLDNGSSLTKNFISIGFTATGNGSVSVIGGNLVTDSNMNVGGEGTGKLIIEGDGLVDGTVTVGNGLDIGSRPPSTGMVTVKGGGELIVNTLPPIGTDPGQALIVGQACCNNVPAVGASGSLNVLSGGTVSANWLRVAGNPGAHGSILVDGLGSTMTSLQHAYIGEFGRGSLTVQNNGLVNITDGLFASNTDVSRGEISVLSGGDVTSDFIRLGAGPNSVGSALVDGASSSLTTAGNTQADQIGSYGNGLLTVQNGGIAEFNDVQIGNHSGSVGAVVVDGIGSTFSTAGTNFNFVGNHGNASLKVQNGGVVDFSDRLFVSRAGGPEGAISIKSGGNVTANKFMLVAQEPGSSGTVNVDGAGSSLQVIGTSDSPNVTTLFAVGRAGVGSLNITNGGSVLMDPLGADPTRYSIFVSGGSPAVLPYVDGEQNGSVLGGGDAAPSTYNATKVTGGGSIVLTNVDGLSAGIIAGNETSTSNVVIDGAPEVDGVPVPSELDTGRLLGCSKGFDRSVVAPLTEANLTEPAGVATLAVRNSGIVRAEIVVIGSGCTLLGDGTVDTFQLINEGTILPGNSPGTLTVTNDFRHAGSMVMEVLGTAPGEFDMLKAGGTVTFEPGSTINVVTRGAALPQGTMTIVEAAATEGIVSVSLDGGIPAAIDTFSGSGIAVVVDDEGVATVVAVSEATPVNLLNALIARVVELNIQTGIENSLDVKLDAATEALADLVSDNDIAALGALDAFINAVDAQTDKAISIEEAESLVSDAQIIVELIGLI